MDEKPLRSETSEAAGKRLNEIFAQIRDQRYPPVHLWNPEFCGDIDMRIARDGTWHYMGTPIARPAMVKLFAGVLRHDEDGKYYLVTPVEKVGITVDDAPYLAVEMTRDGSGADQVLSFGTQTGDLVIADTEHPIRLAVNKETGEPSPYVLVRDRLEALIARPVYYDLADLAEVRITNGRHILGVWSSGEFFELGEVE